MPECCMLCKHRKDNQTCKETRKESTDKTTDNWDWCKTFKRGKQ